MPVKQKLIPCRDGSDELDSEVLEEFLRRNKQYHMRIAAIPTNATPPAAPPRAAAREVDI